MSKKSKFIVDEATITQKKIAQEFARTINQNPYTDEEIEVLKKERLAARFQMKHIFDGSEKISDIFRNLSDEMHKHNPNPDYYMLQARSIEENGKPGVIIEFVRR